MIIIVHAKIHVLNHWQNIFQTNIKGKDECWTWYVSVKHDIVGVAADGAMIAACILQVPLLICLSVVAHNIVGVGKDNNLMCHHVKTEMEKNESDHVAATKEEANCSWLMEVMLEGSGLLDLSLYQTIL